MSGPHPLELRAVIFDWAGTIVDHGSRAPVEAFREVFRRRGVPIAVEEARGPMGMEKRDHIAALVAMPRIAAAWRDLHGHAATDVECQQMYDEFLPVQKQLLEHYAQVIPGVLETLADCRQRGLAIGSSSGYAAPLMERLVGPAREQALEVDAVVSASEVPAGRPAPWMIFRNMERLGVYPPAAVVTVDDTPVGMEAGIHAGTWTIGVIETGNLFGLTEPELQQLPAQERRQRAASGGDLMTAAGAHYAIHSVADLPPVLDAINHRLARGERP